MDWLNTIGFVGVALYMGSYAALQSGLMRGDGYLYALVNGSAAACILVSLLEDFNLSSALIQISWIAISLVGVIRLYIINSRLKFSEDEATFLAQAMPELSKIDARKFLNIAMSIRGEEGVELTQEGEPIKHLAFLLSGEARVESAGVEVARIKPGNYIGDVTYMLGEPATATVLLNEPSHYMIFEVDTLRAYLEKHPAIRRQLEESAADNLRKKLTATTKSTVEMKAASNPVA